MPHINLLRAEPELHFTITTGPPIVYGAVMFAPTTITIESGCIKDYITGMLGAGRGRVAGTVKEQHMPSNSPVYCKV